MWQLAAETLSRFRDVVVTAVGRDGYPISVRQSSSHYDAGTGEMPVRLPTPVAVKSGPANILAHHHDANLSDLQMVQIKGRLEKRDGDWIFVSVAFTPPSSGRLASMRAMARAMRRSSRRYLAARGLPTPKVNWAAIKGLQRQAQDDRRRASQVS
jgi:hypothetical protein